MKIILDYLPKRYYDVTKFSEVLMENAITKRLEANLPITVDDLNQFIIIGKERLNAQKAKIRAIEKTNMAIAAKEAALADAQDMADILLDAEVRLGEILEAIPQTPPIGFSNGNRKSLPPDITKKQSHQAQTLSKNPHIVEQIKTESRAFGEIPTASKVYQLIKDKPAVNKNEDSDAIFHLKRWWKKATKKDRQIFLSWIESEG